jgi:molybdopterin molybdotransferase
LEAQHSGQSTMKDFPWSPALNACLALLPPPKSEEVSRQNALGRLLLESILADRDYPSGDLSMMDGYAVSEDVQETYLIAGENSPGCGPGRPLDPGTVRRIFTGAELPQSATRIVPQELTSREGDRLKIDSYPDTAFIRPQGSESRKGEPILEPGIRVSPVEQSLLAAVGVASIRVAIRPRVAHIVTGDELIDPDSSSPGSSIRDSNSDLVATTLLIAGYLLAGHRRVGDSREILTTAVQETAEECDLLLISGASSVGDHDHARVALESAGFHFETHGVNLRPGKPLGIARRGNQWAIALPGNPVSHLVALHLFVIPILRGLEGAKNIEPEFIEGILEQTLATEVPRRPTFWPATARLKNGAFHLSPRRFLSSGDLIGIAHANALVFLPAGMAIPPSGARIPFLSLNPGFNSPSLP